MLGERDAIWNGCRCFCCRIAEERPLFFNMPYRKEGLLARASNEGDWIAEKALIPTIDCPFIRGSAANRIGFVAMFLVSRVAVWWPWRPIPFEPESRSMRWNASSVRCLEYSILRFIVAWKAAILSWTIEYSVCENELKVSSFAKNFNSILSFCAGFENLSLQSTEDLSLLPINHTSQYHEEALGVSLSRALSIFFARFEWKAS